MCWLFPILPGRLAKWFSFARVSRLFVALQALVRLSCRWQQRSTASCVTASSALSGRLRTRSWVSWDQWWHTRAHPHASMRARTMRLLDLLCEALRTWLDVDIWYHVVREKRVMLLIGRRHPRTPSKHGVWHEMTHSNIVMLWIAQIKKPSPARENWDMPSAVSYDHWYT